METYDSITEYLLERFGEVAVKRFVKLVDNKIKLILSRPVMFRLTGQKTKYLYYQHQ